LVCSKEEKIMTEQQFDIEISGEGVYAIHGMTLAGGAWLLENVPDAQIEVGDVPFAYSDSGNMTRSIADGAHESGLAVAVNGRKYLGNNALEAAKPQDAPAPALSEEVVLYDCGICGSLHPWSFEGDCRDDSQRFQSEEDYADKFEISVDRIVVRSWEERQGADG
jgi:hypothetical protein